MVELLHTILSRRNLQANTGSSLYIITGFQNSEELYAAAPLPTFHCLLKWLLSERVLVTLSDITYRSECK